MKGLIIGLAAGMAAGALLAVNCKECRKMIDKASAAAEKKMHSFGKKESENVDNSGCECGEDCDCVRRANDCGSEEQHECECGEDSDCD